MIKYVIFDLDGTLLDTTEGVIESAIFAAKQIGCQELPMKTMHKFIGPPIQESFKEYYGLSVENAQVAAELFRNHYKDFALLKANPYPGIYELCGLLLKKNIKMAVATYKREDYALTLLNHFSFQNYCQAMHGADNFNQLTKADIIEMCLSDLGADRENSVLIGDTIHDAIGAQNAKIAFIGVTYGFGFKTKNDVDVFPNIGTADYPLQILDLL